MSGPFRQKCRRPDICREGLDGRQPRGQFEQNRICIRKIGFIWIVLADLSRLSKSPLTLFLWRFILVMAIRLQQDVDEDPDRAQCRDKGMDDRQAVA
jgi:hypothetical protein